MSFARRKFRSGAAAAALAIVGALSLAACGGNDDDTTAAPSTELVVYSPQGEGERGAYIADKAQADLGLTVKFFSGGGGELTERLVAEKNNAQADVALGFGISQLYRLADEGTLEDYQPDWSGLIPKQFTQEAAPFTLFSQTPIVIAYNSAKLSAADAPTTWEDLADPKWKDKFVFPGLDSQTGQAAITGLLWRYADDSGEVSQEGWDVAYAVLRNSASVPEGAKFDWGKVASGELPIVVNWLGGIQVGAADNDLDLDIVSTKDGTPYVTAGIALVQGTKNADKAKEFIDWFGSADFQAGFVTETKSDTPINTEALDQLPDAAAALEGIEPQEIDWEVASSKQTEWLQKIRLEVGR